jgi:hypothetical protein
MQAIADAGRVWEERRLRVGPWSTDVVTAAMLGLRVAVLATVVADLPWFPSATATRFHEIAHGAGSPYRDYSVEYPIGELVLIEAVGSWSLGTARAVLAVVAFGADLVTFACLARGWGREVARRYLVAGAPLLWFVYRRSDMVAVALAAAAALAARRGRAVRGGALLGLATLSKLWPAVLMPIVAVRRRATGVAAAAVTVLTGVAAWLAVGGVEGIRQVVGLRGASGWELESTVGAIAWPILGEHRYEQGANRTGSIPVWARVAMVAVLAAGVAAVWLRARHRSWDPAGVPALVSVAILLVCAPVLSPQYLAWLLPWTAIASVDAVRLYRVAVVPIAVTGVIVALWYLDVHIGRPANQVVMIARNLALLAIPLTWWMHEREDGRTPSRAS